MLAESASAAADFDAQPIMAPAIEPRRWFLRCRHYLEPFAIELPREQKAVDTAGMNCPYCNTSDLSVLGYVHRFSVYENQERTACDTRCTHAPGNKCECQCGGKNHGTGRVVTVARERGAVKLFASEAQHARDFDKRAKRLRELDEALDLARRTVEARFSHLTGARNIKARRGWIDESEYRGICDWDRALRLIEGVATKNTHAGRIKYLAAIAAEYGVQP